MSYRCERCTTVCENKQIRVVTETRVRNHPKRGSEIAKEECLCAECALAAGSMVKVVPARNGALPHVQAPTNIIGSA